MLALVNTPGGQDPAEIQEVKEPSPAPDEALIEVRAFSLNRGELRLLASRPEGWRPGQDVSGVVVREAEKGGPREGERVVGLVDGGGWAERVPVPVERLAVLPEGVGFAEAAALPVAGLTALRALRVGGLLLGKRVLVTGASGGVGRFAVELALRAGSRVAGVVGNSERAGGLEELGAEEVVTNIEELSGPFDLVLESVGGASLTAALRLVGPDGTVVMFGNSSGEPSEVAFGRIFSSPRAKLYAFFVYESADKRTFGEDLTLLVSMVASGSLRPQVGIEANWRELGEVITALRERRVGGKVVLRVE
jgi:NADPH2:quinone reductase